MSDAVWTRLEPLRRPEDLPGLLHCGETLIVRGNGRSYGDLGALPGLETITALADGVICSANTSAASHLDGCTR